MHDLRASLENIGRNLNAAAPKPHAFDPLKENSYIVIASAASHDDQASTSPMLLD
jgi:hypothetical protein